MNNFVISGGLGRKPELKESKGGMPYTRLSVAVEGWSSKDKKKTTDWFQVTVFGDRAKFLAEKMDKGCKVLCTGRLTEKKDQEGKSQFAAELFANEVEVLTWPKDGEPAAGAPRADDIPF